MKEIFLNNNKRLLLVNLTENTTEWNGIKESTLKKYPSGLSLSLALYKEYQEYNPIVFTAGESVYSSLLSTSLCSVVFKSSQTNKVTYGQSNISFASVLNSLKVSSIVIIGRARKLSYIDIREDGVSIQQCEQFRESNYNHFSSVISKGDNDSVIAIGEAGEKGVVFATAYSDNYIEIASGGVGAVMGTSNLKGLVASSEQVAPSPSKSIVKKLSKSLTSSKLIKKLQTEGSPTIIDNGNKFGWLPVKYFSSRRDPRAEYADGKECSRHYQTYLDPCNNCFISCRRCNRDNKSLAGYEEIMSLGLMNGFFDIDKIQLMKDACLDKGLECASIGEFLAYIATLDHPDYTFPQLKGASVDEFVRIINLIGSKKGLGENLAKGFALFPEALLCQNKPVLFDLRGSDAQAVFYAFREEIPAYADLFLGITKNFKPEMSAIFALYLRIYSHALSLIGVPPMLATPLFFEKKAKTKYINKLHVELMCKSFNILGLKGKDIIKYGLESVLLFDELAQSDKTIPEYFVITPDEGEDKHTVPYTQLMFNYNQEMSKLVKTLLEERE